MSSIREAVIDAFNEQTVAIQEGAAKDGGATFVTLVTLGEAPDQGIKVHGVNTPVLNIARLLASESQGEGVVYRPFGSTALFDAVGRAINEVADCDTEEGNVAFLVQIFSDGWENASVEFTSEGIAELVRAKQATGRWTFAYFGANQDLADVSKQLGIPPGNMIAFAATTTGTRSVGAAGQSLMNNYYEGRTRGVQASTSFNMTSDKSVLNVPEIGLLADEEDESI